MNRRFLQHNAQRQASRILLFLIGLASCGVDLHAETEMVSPPLELAGAASRTARTAGKARDVKAKRAAGPADKASPVATRIVRTLRIDPAPVTGVPSGESARTGAPESVAAPIVIANVPPPVDPDVKAFCGNIGKAASDARVAWQAAKLVELEAALKARIAEYETRMTDWREWLARREDAMKRAEDAVVAIYARMKPDAAAAQISALDDAMAAAVVMKLNPRNASAILGEMPAERAAQLSDAITGARAKRADEKKG